MKLIKDEELLEGFIERYSIKELFSDFENVSEHLMLVLFPKNTFIYTLEEHNKYAYFMVSGNISLHANSINGRNQLIRICDAPVFIGDMEMLGYHEASNTIRTTKDSMFIALPIEFFSGVIKYDVKFANYICKLLAEKMYYFSSQQMTNKMNTAYENVSSYILAFSDEKGYFTHNLAKLSEVLGISYRHLLRVLKKLTENCIITKEGKGYFISEREELIRLSEGDLSIFRN